MKITMVFLAVAGVAIAFVSWQAVRRLGVFGAKPWKISGNPEVIALANVRVVPGGHCESSAIMNALNYEGYEISECEITGGGSALAFMFQKGPFPFLGGRNEDMRERFFAAANIVWHRGNADAADTGWAEIESLLSGGIPVIIRNDMRFLSYRYGGKHGPRWASFGGHYVTLFGIDATRSLAYVSDTEYSGLQTVSLADLQSARTSKTRMYPPHAEFYWAEKAPAGFSLDRGRLARASIAGVIGNYRAIVPRPAEGGGQSADGKALLVGLAGLEKYPAALASFESWAGKPFLFPAELEYMAGNIEDFGTGGASFRALYREYLARLVATGSFPELAPLLPFLDESIASWHALSADFRAASREIKGMDGSARTRLFTRLAERAEGLYRNEKAFYTALVAASRAAEIAIPEE